MAAKPKTVIEKYHDVSVADPYRWLEDSDSKETTEWMRYQNDKARAYLDSVQERSAIKDRLTCLWNYQRHSVPKKAGGRYFYQKNDGLQNQPILYMKDVESGEPVPVIDPNTLSEDGTIALTQYQISKDGKLIAYALSKSGSDWQEIHIRDIDSKRDLSDIIKWCKFNHIAWMPDGKGFIYSRYPEPGSVPPEDASNYNKVYLHKLGTAQNEDDLVYECPEDKELGFDPYVTDDGKYVFLIGYKGTDPKNLFYYRRIDGESFMKLVDEFDAAYRPAGNQGSRVYFHTDLDAPKGRVVAADIDKHGKPDWHEIIPESDDTIEYVLIAGGYLAVVYLHDAHHKVALYDLDGRFINEIALPQIGSIVGISGKENDTEMFMSFASFLYPAIVFRYDFSSGELTEMFESELNFDPDDFETDQVFYKSKDGTEIPMFIVHKKGIKRDGSNPTLLYGYGGFNISMTPNFNPANLVWIENGGIYAVACLRGGNEYGEAWHKAGMLANKQNVFDDFSSAAEWLIDKKYTSVPKLSIMGGSNGGLLVAACMLQRPDLFGAVVCRVPVIDMLRYHRFTAGRFWTGEYGNAETDPNHFRFLIAYSPLHNVKQNIVYPPVLIMTADTDDRVVPMHSLKFAATLQAAAVANNPILLRIEMKAGHGAGKPTSKIIDETADIYAFLGKELSVGWKFE